MFIVYRNQSLEHGGKRKKVGQVHGSKEVANGRT
jgi:hypothetical protein